MLPKNAKRRTLCFVFAVLWLFSLFLFPISAEERQTDPLPSLDNALAVRFFHIDSGFEIASKNAESILPAGPTGKVVAGLIACEVLGSHLNETVIITENMIADSAGYRLKLEVGEMLTVEDLLYAAICGSYNDAFDALGVLISGTKQDFVSRMNARAVECGATNTNYADVSGILDASTTTVNDTARIALVAAQNELYTRITATASYKKNGYSIDNRNSLISGKDTNLYYNAKCRGMSAGYTNLAGNCAVTLSKSEGGNYICVVLGGADGPDGTNHAYALTNSLIRWVDRTYTYLEIISPETVVCSIDVTVSDLITSLEVKTNESLYYFLPADCNVGDELTYSLRLTHPSLEAPVAEGMHVGYVAILYQGKVIASAPLYTAGSAERSSFISSLKSMQSLVKSRPFVAGGSFFLLAMLGWILTEFLIRRHRHRRWDKYFSEKLEAPERMARRRRPPQERK